MQNRAVLIPHTEEANYRVACLKSLNSDIFGLKIGGWAKIASCTDRWFVFQMEMAATLSHALRNSHRKADCCMRLRMRQPQSSYWPIWRIFPRKTKCTGDLQSEMACNIMMMMMDTGKQNKHLFVMNCVICMLGKVLSLSLYFEHQKVQDSLFRGKLASIPKTISFNLLLGVWRRRP